MIRPHALFAVLFALTLALFAQVAFAQEDLTPPTLVSVSFEPQTVDTSKGPATITMTAIVTDDLSGVMLGTVTLYNERTGRTYQIPFLDSLADGIDPHGRFLALATFPQYSAYGEYEMTGYWIRDRVGNSINVRRPETAEEKQRAGESWPSLFNQIGFAVSAGNPPAFTLYLPQTTR